MQEVAAQEEAAEVAPLGPSWLGEDVEDDEGGVLEVGVVQAQVEVYYRLQGSQAAGALPCFGNLERAAVVVVLEGCPNTTWPMKAKTYATPLPTYRRDHARCYDLYHLCCLPAHCPQVHDPHDRGAGVVAVGGVAFVHGHEHFEVDQEVVEGVVVEATVHVAAPLRAPVEGASFTHSLHSNL